MKEKSEEYKKVFFEFFNDILDEDYVESVWAAVEDEKEGLYKLKNIPFFVKSYSNEDIVHAELENNRLVVKGLVEESGNSTLQVFCYKEEDVEKVRKRLKDFGCASELSHLSKYFSVDVPSNIDFNPIKEYLTELEQQEVLGYSEACLAH